MHHQRGSYILRVKEALFLNKSESNIFSGEGIIFYSTFWDRKPLSSQKHS